MYQAHDLSTLQGDNRMQSRYENGVESPVTHWNRIEKHNLSREQTNARNGTHEQLVKVKDKLSQQGHKENATLPAKDEQLAKGSR